MFAGVKMGEALPDINHKRTRPYRFPDYTDEENAWYMEQISRDVTPPKLLAYQKANIASTSQFVILAFKLVLFLFW